MLRLLFSDEIENDENLGEDTADKNADYCLFKINSLSSHKHILPMPPKKENSINTAKLGTSTNLSQNIMDDGNGNYIIG